MRVKAQPETSLVAHIDYSTGFRAAGRHCSQPASRWHTSRVRVGVVGFVVGAALSGWYVGELNAVFIGIGLLCRRDRRDVAWRNQSHVYQGAADMTAAALMVGFARTIEVVLVGRAGDRYGHQFDRNVVRQFGPEFASVGMLVVQTICNLFIPSGSGQAFVTMPIMSPLATLTGVPQQTAVLAYQFGDGFTNMIVPTSALGDGRAGTRQDSLRRVGAIYGPLLLKLFALAIVFLILSLHIGDAVGFNPV